MTSEFQMFIILDKPALDVLCFRGITWWHPVQPWSIVCVILIENSFIYKDAYTASAKVGGRG